mmetsp:Transcript_749/g.1577  ORF Transcript_749/g.1577 Transcript_749/m.1577 type:complete len:353 (+) Transcript_749:793-1851(+)
MKPDGLGVDIVEAHLTLEDLRHAEQAHSQRRLARAGAADNADLLPRLGREADAAQRRLELLAVPHPHVVKDERAALGPRVRRPVVLNDSGGLGLHPRVLVNALHRHHIALQLREGADQPVEHARHLERVRDGEPHQPGRGGVACVDDREESRRPDGHVSDELEPDAQPSVGGVVGVVSAGETVIEAEAGLGEILLLAEGTDGGHARDGLAELGKDRALGHALKSLDLTRRLAVEGLHLPVDEAHGDDADDEGGGDPEDHDADAGHAHQAHEHHLNRLPQLVISRILIRREAVQHPARRRSVEEAGGGAQHVGKHRVMQHHGGADRPEHAQEASDSDGDDGEAREASVSHQVS